MNITVLDGYTLNPGDISWEAMEKLGRLTVYDRTPKELIVSRMEGAEAVFTNKTPITRETIKACPKLKFIGVLATGYNVVDDDAAAERNIPVCNIPTYGTSAVAQFAIGLLLEICHHIGSHAEAVKRGEWEANPDWCFWHYPLIELAGKTMGIIGFGKIGQATARIAQALGMKILAYDTVPKAGPSDLEYRNVSLEELLAEADVISFHCPLFPTTEGIINQRTIERMKDGVILINTSRGPLVREQDLADALNSGKVAAAGLDVVSTEPIRGDNPLLSAKNCIITPHIAWAPKESRQRLMAIAADNLDQFLQGNVVNAVNQRRSNKHE